jgi:hypothetical protein
MVFGQFRERGNVDGFAWLRGFEDANARATVNAAFYDGPLWKERAQTMNERLVAIENVLLLRPLGPERGVALLPPVDAVREAAAAPGASWSRRYLRSSWAGWMRSTSRRRHRSATARRAWEAAVLVTDDVRTASTLPARTDGTRGVARHCKDDEAVHEQIRAGRTASQTHYGGRLASPASPS